MFTTNARRNHSKVATWASFPLATTIITGMGYRISRACGADKASVSWLMDLHQMSVIYLESVYPVCVGVLGLWMLSTGAAMLDFRALCCCRCFRRGAQRSICPATWTVRACHKFIASIAIFPIGITVLTGTLFCILRSWFQVDTSNIKFLMALHQGSIIFPPALYVLFTGGCFLLLLLSGFRMTAFASDWFEDRKQVAHKVKYDILEESFRLVASDDDDGVDSDNGIGLGNV